MPTKTKPNWRYLISFSFIALLLAILSLFIPWNTSSLEANPRPAQNYVAALKKIETFRNKEKRAMYPLCQVQLLTQGQKVQKAIVLVHGYTSCPQQFMELGKRFYDLGYNVLLAPMPHHGLSDRMTEAHSFLRASELAAYADEVVDIAQGLGEEVAMAGLSVGGVVTAFAATHREDIDLALLISPAFGYKAVPSAATAAAMNIYSLLPNGYGWWDAAKQEQGGAPHGYPRYAKRALAEALRLGFAARRHKPMSKKVIVVTNPNDAAVNNELIDKTIQRWRKQGIALEVYAFPMELQLDHDLIEPTHPAANIEVVYPKLVALVER